MKDQSNAPLWGLGGLIVGAWVGNRLGWNHGGYGGYGGGCGGPGYGGGYGPGYGAPGYYTGDRPCHEDKQDDKIACIQAQLAAVAMSDKKNEKIAMLEDKIVEGKIFAATCRKPDGDVFLSPRHLANGYRGESRVLDSHPIGRDGFRDGRRDGFRDGCCDGFRDDNWY